jgi:DNA-binding NarL/FixJ family response regulator
MRTKSIRILLADDHPALRSALTLLLETRLHARIVGESFCMEDLLVRARRLHPDVVILDGDLPGQPRDGRIAALHAIQPGVKIVVTSSQPGPEQPARSLRADAYISKFEPPDRMVRILQTM